MIRRLRQVLAVVLMLGSTLIGAVPVGATPTFTHYPLPSPASQPVELTTGPDGALWFTEGGSNARIGRITTAGALTEFPVPVDSPTVTKLDGILTGPDGALWYTYTQDRAIGRITTSGAITKYPIPFNIQNPLQPSNLVTGPDGAIWISGGGTPALGRITTSGSYTQFPLPIGSGAVDITVGPDGALWFTGFRNGASSIGRMTTSGAVTWYQFAPNMISLNGIVAGPDGALWFTAINGNLIGRITTNGVFTSYSLPNSTSEPWDITNGPDGALWFTESGGQRIGRITTVGVVTEYPIGSTNFPKGITTGPDGALWFAEPSSNRIGRLMPDPLDTVAPTVTPTPDRQPNANNWYDNDVTISWAATDPTPSSGAPTTPPPTLATQEGTHTYASAPSCDPAGNCATGQLAVSIDKTDPTITYSVSPMPNLMGWNNTQVVVSFTCDDTANTNQSGIDSCTQPITVPTGNGTFSVEGAAVDRAGNTTTTTAVVSIDDTAPLVGHQITPQPTVSGWNTTDVTVSFACNDNLSLIFSCAEPVTLESEGANQVVTGLAVDNAGNPQTDYVIVNIDKTVPTLGMLDWGSSNPKPLTATATLTVPADDATSGLARAEYFVGINNDPGQGNGAPMTLANPVTNSLGAIVHGDFTATFGTSLPAGTYFINVRTQDVAGQWSDVTTGSLVVFDATGPTDFTASKQAAPSLVDSVLPGLISNTQNDKADLSFDVLYTASGTVDPASTLNFAYETGKACNSPNPNNCHSTSFTASTTTPNNIALLSIGGANSSAGSFQGVGTLGIDGVTTTNPFRVVGTDGGRTSPTQNDQVTLYIYAPGANPNTATELYRLHVQVSGNWLKIR
jgi:virginiamycin B lyase